MKAVGFFLAVFFSMLAVFLVATGEVSRWLSPSEDLADILIPQIRSAEGENRLDFEFWDVRKGRRRFIMTAELNQELRSRDPLDKLQEFSLRNGKILFPFTDRGESPDGVEAGDSRTFRELELSFESAVYRKEEGLTSKMPLFVSLRSGKGTANDGTEFYFQELDFSQSQKDKSRFEIRSSKPVRIQKGPALDVRSPSGLEGVLTDDVGFQDLLFRPPVYTYLDPSQLGLFALGPEARPSAGDGEGGAAPGQKADRRVVAATSKGPLEFRFRVPSLRPAAGAREGTGEIRRTRITFNKDVVIYEIDRLPEGDKPPPHRGNRFECQQLELEIDASTKKPVPVYALATWDDGRVRGHVVRGHDRLTLEGDRLEWFNLSPTPGVGTDEIDSEAILSGKPRLIGKDVFLEAERAVLKPRENRVVLHAVTGNLKGAQLSRERGQMASPGPVGRSRKEGEGASGGPAEAGDLRAEETATGSAGQADPGDRLFDNVDFQADEADVFFHAGGQEEGKVLSHFVARSGNPRGVTIDGRNPPAAGDSGETRRDAPQGDFRAAGKTLRYAESERRLTLEGTPRELPRLSQGKSWMEAERIHISLEGGHARFEGRVQAYFDKESGYRLAARPAKAGAGGEESAENGQPLPSFEINSEELEVHWLGRRLRSAAAKGTSAKPVVLSTLGTDRCRFLAPEVHLNSASRVVQLRGSQSAGLARVEFDNGEARAGRIDFDRNGWKCYLRDQAEVRLRSARDKPGEGIRIRGAKTDVVFRDGLRVPAAGSTPRNLAELDRIRSLHAVAEEGGRISVTAKSFSLFGEEVAWDGDKRELRFFGRGLQEIQLDHEELRGPVKAREIIYESDKRLITLRGSVSGELRQPQRSRDPAGPSRPRENPPLRWDFKTSVLEIQLEERSDGMGMELAELRARENVLLENRQNGLKLLGDDLVYDHAQKRVRVFSKDGRLQTLVHYGKDAAAPQAAKLGNKPDTVLSQEIWVFFDEESSGFGRSRQTKQLIRVQFKKQVIATFDVPSRKMASAGRTGEADLWKMEADTLDFYLNPEQDPRSPQALPRAVASGNVVVTSELFRAQGARAEYRQAERSLKLVGAPARLVCEKQNINLEVPVIRFRKEGSRIVVIRQ